MERSGVTEYNPSMKEASKCKSSSVEVNSYDEKLSSEITAVSALANLSKNIEKGFIHLENGISQELEDSQHCEEKDEVSTCEEGECEERPISETSNKKRKRKKLTFPQRLLEILSRKEFSQIISWMPHGNSFIVLKRNKFAEIVLPQYFKKTMFTSFTRKLNRWGFSRIGRGSETGAYFNPFFNRDEPALCLKMRCQKKNERRTKAPTLIKKKQEEGEPLKMQLNLSLDSIKSNDMELDGSISSISQMVDDPTRINNEGLQNDNQINNEAQTYGIDFLKIINLKRRREHRILMAASMKSHFANIGSLNLSIQDTMPIFQTKKYSYEREVEGMQEIKPKDSIFTSSIHSNDSFPSTGKIVKNSSMIYLAAANKSLKIRGFPKSCVCMNHIESGKNSAGSVLAQHFPILKEKHHFSQASHASTISSPVLNSNCPTPNLPPRKRQPKIFILPSQKEALNGSKEDEKRVNSSSLISTCELLPHPSFVCNKGSNVIVSMKESESQNCITEAKSNTLRMQTGTSSSLKKWKEHVVGVKHQKPFLHSGSKEDREQIFSSNA